MKIYVAGKYNTKRVSALMSEIEASKLHQLTYDWRKFPPDLKPPLVAREYHNVMKRRWITGNLSFVALWGYQ